MKRAKLLEKRIQFFKEKEEIALIPYLTCWDPDLKTTEAILWEMLEVNPVCIELGFPFSDPVADGPTIQKAIVRALAHQPTLEAFFEFVESLISKGFSVPLLCMTYYNIIYHFGLERTVSYALDSGLSGFIIPDLPIEEAGPWLKANNKKGLATIFLVAPTSSEERVKKIAKKSTGFLYYVSLTGITGARERLPEDLIYRLTQIKNLSPVPVAVGFGISKSEHIKLLNPYVDALVVGSAVVNIIEREAQRAPQAVKNFLKSLKNENS